jgi:hypothetical protein
LSAALGLEVRNQQGLGRLGKGNHAKDDLVLGERISKCLSDLGGSGQ